MLLASFFCMWISVVLKSCVEKYILSQLNDLGTMVEDQLIKCVWIFSVPLIYISTCIPVSHCFNYCNFVVIFEIGNLSYPIVLLCSNLFWLLIVVLNFHMNLKDEYVNFYKEGSCNSDWDYNECIDEIS